ncbi:MAG: hypothetical protein ABH840_03990 [Nanoarchaeota archaeon]
MRKGMRRGVFLFAFSFMIILISLSFVSADCDSNNIIMKISSQNNAHAALWNDATYNQLVCYSSAVNRACVSPLLWLSKENNSHVSTTNANGYNIPVCFPDGCSITTTCSGITVASMYDYNNSHIAVDDSYPIKICCGTGLVAVPGDTYWTDMRDVQIGSAELNDEVKMNVESSLIDLNMDIDYTVYKKRDGLVGYLISLIFGDKKIRNIAGEDSAVWGADEEGNNYYFTAELPDGTVYSSENEPYGLLNVTSPEDNFFPVVIMDEPIAESKHLVNSEIDFKQSSYDDDDVLKAIWNFNDGNITTLLNCNNGESCDTNHKYGLNGVKTVRLTAQEMRISRNQKSSTARRIYIYSEGINAFAVISQPDPATINLPIMGNVDFNASQSYIANCSSCPADVCPVCPVIPASRCYNVSGIVNENMEKIQCFDYLKGLNDITVDVAGTYNMWFNWTFDEPPYSRYGNWVADYPSVVGFTRVFAQSREHVISLRVGYEPHSA